MTVTPAAAAFCLVCEVLYLTHIVYVSSGDNACIDIRVGLPLAVRALLCVGTYIYICLRNVS